MSDQNPLEIIKNDHEEVKSLFEDYDEAETEEKEDLVNSLCEELIVHLEMEEQFFYPALDGVPEGKDHAREARKEHDEVKDMMRDIDLEADEEELDNHIEMIKTAVMDHVKHEEDKIFPLAEQHLKDDFEAMAKKMEEFKERDNGEELMQKLKSR